MGETEYKLYGNVKEDGGTNFLSLPSPKTHNSLLSTTLLLIIPLPTALILDLIINYKFDLFFKDVMMRIFAPLCAPKDSLI